MYVTWTDQVFREVEVKEAISYRPEIPPTKVLVKEAEPAKPAQYKFGHGDTPVLVSPAVTAKKAKYEDIPGSEERQAQEAEYEIQSQPIEFSVFETQLLSDSEDKYYVNSGNPPERFYVPENAIYTPNKP
tara:strand:+ start:62 stop:451 length:390 start_codon:yes stop_codon:yes gene_type:complete